MTETAEQVVQRQVDAYNARDLERFVAAYHEDIEIYRMPAPQPTLSGKAALSAFYGSQRFNLPELNAQIVKRITLGNKVIDHERVRGIAEQPVEVAAVYEVTGGLIRKVWFFAPG